MTSFIYTPIYQSGDMKSYVLKVVFEKDKWPDEPDEKALWRAYVPALPAAHAWGDTQHEALENLKNAVDLIIEDMRENGESIPADAVAHVSDEPLLAVT